MRPNEQRTKEFNRTMGNAMTMGNVKLAPINIQLLYIPDEYQRFGNTVDAKSAKLAREWNPNQMDPLTVCPHAEDSMFAVINGGHRLRAAELLDLDYLLCRIIEVDEKEEDRLRAEAELFLRQSDNVDTLSPGQKHKAALLCGIKENIELQELVDKYGIALELNGKKGGYRKEHNDMTLTSFSRALALTKTRGKVHMDNVFDIICKSRYIWNSKGTHSTLLNSISNVYLLHADCTGAKEKMIETLSAVGPDLLMSQAYAKYPNRREVERITMYLEDILCDSLAIEKRYHGGSITSVINEIKKQMDKAA